MLIYDYAHSCGSAAVAQADNAPRLGLKTPCFVVIYDALCVAEKYIYIYIYGGLPREARRRFFMTSSGAHWPF